MEEVLWLDVLGNAALGGCPKGPGLWKDVLFQNISPLSTPELRGSSRHAGYLGL